MNLNAALLATLVAVAAALLVWVLLNWVSASSVASSRNAALARYGAAAKATLSAEVKASNSAIGAALDKYRNKLETQLRTADLGVSPVAWMTLQTIATVLVFVVLTARINNPILALLMAGGIAFFGTRMVLNARIEKRRAEFETNLPMSLQLLASGIRSGLTFDQALESISSQDKTEVGKQFGQAVAEASVDGQLEPALLGVAQRMNSADLRWLVSALEIQREIGGSLSHILDTVAETIRVRADVRREVRVLSAEGKLSGYVLIAMPFVVLLALMLIRPSYVTFFWTDPIGMVMAVGFIVLVAVGWIWLQRITKVKD